MKYIIPLNKKASKTIDDDTRKKLNTVIGEVAKIFDSPKKDNQIESSLRSLTRDYEKRNQKFQVFWSEKDKSVIINGGRNMDRMCELVPTVYDGE